MDVVVLATRNPGKARELQSMLSGVVDRVESLADHPSVILPAEGEHSYRENAEAKARAVWDALGSAAIGDDSGLEVDALKGAPGIRSARFAGPDADDAANNRRLLQELEGVASDRRTARFRCVLVFIDRDGSVVAVEETCEGRILETPRGTLGFGYDPLFLPEGDTKTFAERPREEKNRQSHRGKAVAALRRSLMERVK